MNLEMIRNKPNLIIGILILYYSVGFLLFMFDQTRALFGSLTPFSLILSFSAVLVFQKRFGINLGISFVLVFVFSIIIEIIGVNTGVLFGNYMYGMSLGPKIMHTPILIGLNWLILIYCSAAIVNHYFTNRIIRIIVGSVLMVLYDLILEYVAPITDMWSWDTPYPGIRNFLMWFLLALIFHSLFQKLVPGITNKPARWLFLIQIIFFGAISVFALSTV